MSACRRDRLDGNGRQIRARPRYLRRRHRRAGRHAALRRRTCFATSSTRRCSPTRSVLDAFGVGEHHRRDFAISAPEVVLAAIAGRTERILLGSAVTVLSTDDPVRVFQRFSTLNAHLERPRRSHSRPRIVHRVVSAVRLRPLALRRAVRGQAGAVRRAAEGRAGHVERARRARRSRRRRSIRRSRTGTLRTWVGVGGSPESVVRAARYGLPLTLAIIGGSPQRFRPYRRSLSAVAREVRPARCSPIAVHSPGHVAATDEQARERALAALRDDDQPHRRRARLAAGDARAVRARSRARRRAVRRLAGDRRREDRPDRPRRSASSRFDLKYSAGTLPHDKLMTSIELFGTEVAPRVREMMQE